MQMTHGWPEGFHAQRIGCRTGLGVDTSLMCSGDLFGQMRLCLQTQRATDNAASLAEGQELLKLRATVAQVLYMATLGGAEAIHQEHEIGSIQVGKRADIVIVRTDSPSMIASTDLAASLVLHASAADVDTVIINGEVVKQSGKLTKVDWAHLKKDLVASRRRIDKRAEGIDWKENTEQITQRVHDAMRYE